VCVILATLFNEVIYEIYLKAVSLSQELTGGIMITVGRVNGKPLTTKESGINRERKKRRFKTPELDLNFLETPPEQDSYGWMYYLDRDMYTVVKNREK